MPEALRGQIGESLNAQTTRRLNTSILFMLFLRLSYARFQKTERSDRIRQKPVCELCSKVTPGCLRGSYRSEPPAPAAWPGKPRSPARRKFRFPRQDRRCQGGLSLTDTSLGPEELVPAFRERPPDCSQIRIDKSLIAAILGAVPREDRHSSACQRSTGGD